jgi:hypothetical protein
MKYKLCTDILQVGMSGAFAVEYRRSYFETLGKIRNYGNADTTEIFFPTLEREWQKINH